MYLGGTGSDDSHTKHDIVLAVWAYIRDNDLLHMDDNHVIANDAVFQKVVRKSVSYKQDRKQFYARFMTRFILLYITSSLSASRCLLTRYCQSYTAI
jgi:hypothetical protein